ncbi:hypothetical protein QR680_000246 [Steinernema hermaphroditum]|uniref:ShKT domain-containing protein n=1 Tax=Steinernema hermaphroditum TaxID=289476 RepID=A0AA39LDQ5_9BILA|nr:hypothetical protein QR680_000246 [Steinernema hermaphroditum]
MEKTTLIFLIIALALLDHVSTDAPAEEKTTTTTAPITTTTEITTTTYNPAYACENKPGSPVDCEANKAKCTLEQWKRVMTEFCPKTCGLCAPSGCLDKTDCSGMQALCRDFEWVQFMRDQCPATCGFCGGAGGCTDVSSSCARNARFCNDPRFSDFLGKNCARTCNRCGGSGGGGGTGPGGGGGGTSCVDSSNKCVTWGFNGFCSNTFYDEAYKRRMCARTCSLC